MENASKVLNIGTYFSLRVMLIRINEILGSGSCNSRISSGPSIEVTVAVESDQEFKSDDI